MPSCPSDNAEAVEQANFWNPDGSIDWDQHRIGWAIAGGCSLLTVIITIISVLQHCRNYNVPREQRQVIRILYMPPVYAVISFFSYRYFRSYTYYSLIYVAYEAVTVSAFLLLLIEYVAGTAHSHSAENALARKDKRPLPIPFCCWRYRPSKAYFMYTVKWSVMQYVIVRPAISIAGIICQAYGVLCDSESWDPHFASVYLSAADFVSISIALYGLLVFFGLTHAELAGRRPLAKFLVIKLIVAATFYQSFVFSMLEGRVIHATQYWTETNIADGLNALAICIEMVFFALAMWWAYTPAEYRVPGTKTKTGIWKPLWDSINFMDFVLEIYASLRFFLFRTTYPYQPHLREGGKGKGKKKMDFGEAFGVARSPAAESGLLSHSHSSSHQQDQDEFVSGGATGGEGGEGMYGGGDAIGMAPYAYGFSAPGASGGSAGASGGSASAGRSTSGGYGGYGEVSPRTAGFDHEARLP